MNKLKLMQQIQFELASKGISCLVSSNTYGNCIYVHYDEEMEIVEAIVCHQSTEQELQQWLDVLVYGPQKAVDMNLSYEG